MPKRKKPTFANDGYEINNGNPIRQVQVTNGCSYYQVEMGRVSGQDVRKNFANARKARSFAGKSKPKAADNGIKTVRSTETQRDAMELLNPFKISLYEAARFYAEHHGVLDRCSSVEALHKEFIAEKQDLVERNALKPASLVDIKHFLKRFSKEFGHQAVDRITAGEIDHFLDGVNGVANRRLHRLYISAFFNWLAAQGRISTNPVRKTRHVPKRMEAPKTYGPSDVERMMNAAPPKLVSYLALGLFGGVRSGERLKLRWRDVDFDRSEIRIHADQPKTKGRTVHMSANLAQFLMPFRGESKAFVVPYGLRSLQRWIKKLFGELEIKAIHQGALHSFTTYHLALHPLYETMQELGYTESDTLFKYCRGSTGDRQQAEDYFAIEPLEQREIIPLTKEAA